MPEYVLRCQNLGNLQFIVAVNEPRRKQREHAGKGYQRHGDYQRVQFYEREQNEENNEYQSLRERNEGVRQHEFFDVPAGVALSQKYSRNGIRYVGTQRAHRGRKTQIGRQLALEILGDGGELLAEALARRVESFEKALDCIFQPIGAYYLPDYVGKAGVPIYSVERICDEVVDGGRRFFRGRTYQIRKPAYYVSDVPPHGGNQRERRYEQKQIKYAHGHEDVQSVFSEIFQGVFNHTHLLAALSAI